MVEQPEPLLKIGVVADTHVPDRVRNLHPELLPGLQKLGVDIILHAGDISSSAVLDELSKIAPVTAVRGNRDWMVGKKIPSMVSLDIAGTHVALLHGHGDIFIYFLDKIKYLFFGYRLERYVKYLFSMAPFAGVIVFGHTHRAVNYIQNGCLLFNPGSAGCYLKKQPPSFGILRFYGNTKVKGEIISMDKACIRNGKWVEI